MKSNEEHKQDQPFIPMTSISSGICQQIAEGVHFLSIQIVNVMFVEQPSGWVLIDAGMPKSSDEIIKEAEEQFGSNTKPTAIYLTHGHFDHVGAIEDLLEKWDVPVYAHEQELPFLTGKKDYPKPDGSVEGGLLAKISPIYPNKAINLGNRVIALPPNGELPDLPGWKWHHTPGHTPGHVSFFRESDRTLIAGDAFITVRQDSLFKVLVQKQELNGPPRYLTIDWKAAKASVEKLHSLKPKTAITGHGLPMFGNDLEENLTKLVEEFDSVAIPDYGKYV